MQVIDTLGQRLKATAQENAQVRAAVERHRLQLEHARRVSELRAQIDIDRHVVLNAQPHQGTAENSGVEILFRCDIDLRGDSRRAGGDVVATVEKIECAVRDVHRADGELVDFVLTLRSGVPMRKVVDQRCAGRIDLEVHVRIDHIDAADADLATPERIDAAGDDDLLDRCEIGIDRTR